MADIKYIDLKDNDAVQFHIFPVLGHSHEDGKINFNAVDELMINIYKTVNKFSENYIWHNEEFHIYPKNLDPYIHSRAGSEPFSFYGSLNYGENIEDVWFLIYLLVELTKEIDGLIISAKDGDGEFLLIEAAEQLPSWVTPETCEGKTFIYRGELHILPLSYEVNNEKFTITNEVLQYIRDNPETTKCGPGVQKAIEYRISGFPNKIEENFHYAILYVPVAVASLLNANEKLIAPSVRAFCDRDLIDIKACRAMKYFPPENRVYTRVKFTRLLYAMLATSKYVPDKMTGWNLPQPNDEHYKAHLLGIKLACGFEILVNQGRDESNKEDSEDCDFSNDPNWKRFLTSLRSKNYFRGLLEHSKQYNQLMENAKYYYRNSCGKSSKPNKSKEILELLNSIDVDIEELKKKESNLPKSDDDSWMNVTQKELNSLLKARFGDNVSKPEDPSSISHRLNDFINYVSGIEGAEFPKKSKTTVLKTRTPKKRKTVKFSPDTKASDNSSQDTAGNASNINFEPEGFINAIQNILDFSIPDDNYWDSEGSGMSSYEDESDMEFGEKMKSTSVKKDKVLIRYMKEMDEELSHTTLGKSFVTENPETNNDEKGDSFEDTEDFKAVDIDVNALKNIISSYKSQMGEAGPAENLLGPLGVKLEEMETDVD